MNPNPRNSADTAEIVAARTKAATDLLQLFGGKTADGQTVKGVLHEHGLEALEASGWKGYLDGVRNNSHARTVAIVCAARANENYTPDLVAALFSRDYNTDQSREWFADVYLSGLAEIFRHTGVGVVVPTYQAGIDLERAAFNVFNHMSAEDKGKFELYLPDEAPRRRLSNDPFAVANEADLSPLTPVQRLYRWAVNKWEQRQEEQEQRRRQRESGDSGRRDAGGLPAPPKTAANPRIDLERKIAETDAACKEAAGKGTPEGFSEAARLSGDLAGLRKQLESLGQQTTATAISAVPAPPATPAVPPPPGASTNGHAADAAPTTTAIPPPPTGGTSGSGGSGKPRPRRRSATGATASTAPPAPAAAATEGDDQREVILAAIASAGKAGAAWAHLVRTGQRTMDQATAWAKDRIPGF